MKQRIKFGKIAAVVFITVLIYIIVVSSLRTVALSGQVSVGHAAFMGVGGLIQATLSFSARGNERK